MILKNTPIEVGKYRISPLVKTLAEGRFAASVSIRSGSGTATHDRVMRLTGIFDTATAAVQYATQYALGWIRERSLPACA